MILYVLSILLVSCYSSSGLPAPNPIPLDPRNATNLSTYSLNTLASSCENSFLSAQIKSKIQECPELVAPSSEKQFKCMLFYDINRQLCAAVASSKLALNDNYTAKIEAPQDVSLLCQAARSWTFSNLGEVYTKNVKLVFENVIRCATTCTDDNSNMFSTELDSNFYCRYYKWGTDMLKSQVEAQQSQEVPPISNAGVISSNSVPGEKTVALKPDVPAPEALPVTATQTKDAVKPASGPVLPLNIPSQLANTHSEKVESPPTANADKATSDKTTSTNKETEAHVEQPIVEPPNPETAPAIDIDNKEKEIDNADDKEISGISGEEQLNVPQVKAPETDDAVKKSETINTADKNESTDLKKSKENDDTKKVIPPVKVVNDQIPDEYQDSQGDDDGDDLALGDTDQQNVELNKNTAIRVDTQFPNEISQKEYYPNADGFSDEDDDHFFSFFLTAIIMVVLLYVLYHNKSKVSKVIMGLLVEGRQPGRRRNSRGHAYKRLDTLEQAMSANTAAPPSKIIY